MYQLHGTHFLYLAYGKPVAASHHQDAFRIGFAHKECGKDEHLVIAVLVEGRELQRAVKEEPKVVPAPREHNLLKGRPFRKHDIVGIQVPLEEVSDLPGRTRENPHNYKACDRIYDMPSSFPGILDNDDQKQRHRDIH